MKSSKWSIFFLFSVCFILLIKVQRCALFFPVLFLDTAPYLASQALDSSLLTQPSPTPSSNQSSSTQLSNSTSSTASQQGSVNAAGSTVPSNSGPGNSSAPSNNLVTSSGQTGSTIPAKPGSFPPFGSMGGQGQGGGPQSGQLGQQAGTQNTGASGDNSSSQAQGPTEPPERYCQNTKALIHPTEKY